MSRDRLYGSLSDQYLRLIGSTAAELFEGDQAAARASADQALATCLLGEATFLAGNPREKLFLDGIREIIRSMEDPAVDFGILLDVSGTRIRDCGSRDTGVVYTPLTIARFICGRTIRQWLLRQINRVAGRKFTDISELRPAGHEAVLARKTLDSVKVLDTSCGTGAFLLTTVEEISRLKLMLGGDRQNPAAVLRETLENCIYGMDIDGGALKIARARLRLLLKQAGDDRWKEAELQLLEANALFTATEDRFDVIVGNPPYMRVKSMYRGDPEGRKLKRAFAAEIEKSGLYRLQDGNLNLYKLFVERNLSLLKADGSLGLIIPAPFLTEATSMRLRQHVFDCCTVEDIVEIPEHARIFGGVNQATAILICHKGEPGSRFSLRPGADIGSLEGEAVIVDLHELSAITDSRMEVPLLTSPALEWAMLKHLAKVPPFRGNDRFFPVGSITVGHLDETIDREFISQVKTGDIFIKGIHLTEYTVDLSENGASPRWVRKEPFLHKRPSSAKTIESPRIIGRNTQNRACKRRLKFAPLPPGYVCGNSIKQIVITDPDIQPLYLLGLLNSSVLNWYFEVFCSQNNIRNYSVEALPIPRAPMPTQDAIAHVARTIMSSSGMTREYLDKRLMDALVYELYFMEMRMLSSAVLSAMEEDAGTEALMSDDIRAIIDLIAGREGFKITQKVTYRQYRDSGD